MFFSQVIHVDAPPSPHFWVFSGQSRFSSSAQIPDPREILYIQIRRGPREVVRIFFDFVLGKITSWSNWVDEELSDRGFANCLEHAGILISGTWKALKMLKA